MRCYTLLFAALVVLASCDSGPVYTDLRIYSTPYDSVDWANVTRLKSQHHDHIGANAAFIAAYDNAGYDVLSLMDYSGNASLSFAWQERLWPPEQWVAGPVLSSFENLKILIPNAEEVGLLQHATSPFLTTYIEGESRNASAPTDLRYRSMNEMFELVRTNGGFPCIAHPWDFPYQGLRGSYCTEIFTAFADARRFQGERAFTGSDRNARLLRRWDAALARNQRVFGIAVNDHFGPYSTSVPDEIRDSGKIEVLADEITLESYQAAFVGGRFFAIRDAAAVKDQYPRVFGISIEDEAVFIEATGMVSWISHGIEIGVGPTLNYDDLLPNATYIRAEIDAADSDSTVYSQAFVIRPVGDIDGDYDIDEQDEALCRSVAEGTNVDSLHVAACNALEAD